VDGVNQDGRSCCLTKECAGQDECRAPAGLHRLGAWLSADRLAELDSLVLAWRFADRTEAVDVAIQFLSQQTRRGTLDRLDFA
jgi:hypothetical protein